MKDAVSLFFGMSTQWRWVGAGMGGVMRTGLDYGVLPTVAAAAEVTLTPDVMDDLKTMEIAAIEAWSRK